MNVSRKRSHRQGKTPQLAAGARYRADLSALFAEGAAMAGADPLGICRILGDAGIGSVIIGGLVVGCHTGRPRATQDVDVIVDVRTLPIAVIRALGRHVGSRKLEKHPSFVSFVKPTRLGEREVLDVITSTAGSYGLVFDNCLKLRVAGCAVRIPSVEMMVVLKYTAAMNPVRQKAKQAQDWADLFAMLDANRKLSIYTATYLADAIVPGWGEDLGKRIAAHRTSGG